MSESAEAGERAEGATGSHLASGESAYSGIKELEVSVVNGTLTCRSADLPAGEVAFEWTYHNGTGGKPPAVDYELRHKKSDGRLVITDHRGTWDWIGHDAARLDLSIRCGPEVVISEANVGNGDLLAEGAFRGDLNVGNGTLQLNGELVADADLNVGNGDVKAELLIGEGSHSANVGNGSIAIALKPQSSVALSANIAVGGIEAPPEILVTRAHLVGASASGSLGDGAAALSVNIGNGSLKVTQGDERPKAKQYGRRLGVDIWRPGAQLVTGLLAAGAVLTQIIN